MVKIVTFLELGSHEEYSTTEYVGFFNHEESVQIYFFTVTTFGFILWYVIIMSEIMAKSVTSSCMDVTYSVLFHPNERC